MKERTLQSRSNQSITTQPNLNLQPKSQPHQKRESNTTQPSPAQPSPGRVEDDASTSQAAMLIPGIRKKLTQTSTHHPPPKSPKQLLTPYAQPPRQEASHRHACQSSPYSRAKRQHARRRARLCCPVLEKKC
jgi:hypothetical protein